MDDENAVVSNGEPATESGSEADSDSGTVTETVIYTDQLQNIQNYQGLQIGLQCVLIGVLLAFSIFNVLKRYL